MIENSGPRYARLATSNHGAAARAVRQRTRKADMLRRGTKTVNRGAALGVVVPFSDSRDFAVLAPPGKLCARRVPLRHVWCRV